MNYNYLGKSNMKCAACDTALSDLESTRKDTGGKYVDLCDHCYSTVADDFIGDKEDDSLMPIIEDNDDFSDLPVDLTDDDLFNEDDSRS